MINPLDDRLFRSSEMVPCMAIFPSFKKAASVQMRSTSERICVEKILWSALLPQEGYPKFPCGLPDQARMWAHHRLKVLDGFKSACAIPRRCFIPLENPLIRWRSCSRPTNSNSFFPSRRNVIFVHSGHFSAKSQVFIRCHIRIKFWAHQAGSRCACWCWSVQNALFSPITWISPLSAFRRPRMAFIVVVFPAPFFPIKPKMLCSGTDISSPQSTSLLPKLFSGFVSSVYPCQSSSLPSRKI